MAVPAERAVTAIVALDEPAGTSTGVCTMATAGLLVDNATLAPPAGAAAVRLTVACPLPPAGTLSVPSVTLDTTGIPDDGAVGVEPPHRIVVTVMRSMAASAAYGDAQCLTRMNTLHRPARCKRRSSRPDHEEGQPDSGRVSQIARP
jgi:hypothetical protein